METIRNFAFMVMVAVAIAWNVLTIQIVAEWVRERKDNRRRKEVEDEAAE